MSYLALKPFIAAMVDLFNPPPLESLSFLQKCGQVLLLTGGIVVGCILFALVGTLILFALDAWPLMLCLLVNGLCAYVTFQVRKFELLLSPVA